LLTRVKGSLELTQITATTIATKTKAPANKLKVNEDKVVFMINIFNLNNIINIIIIAYKIKDYLKIIILFFI